MKAISSLTGVAFKPGHNPAIKSCLLTLDDVDYVHRPLCFYLLITTLRALGASLLWRAGFRRYARSAVA